MRLLLALPLLLLASPAVATEFFSAVISARPGVESDATGTGQFILNNSETELTYSVEVSNLTSTEIAAHIHSPDGTVLYTFPLGATKNGVWQNPGNINVLLLRTEQLYVLVHTENNGGGEARGNILLESVPTSSLSVGWIKSAYQ